MFRIVILLLFSLLIGCFFDPNGECYPVEEKKENKTHGIKSFWSVEGIVPDIHTRDTLFRELGRTNLYDYISGNLYYYYPSRGLKFIVDKDDKIVSSIYIYGKNWKFGHYALTGYYMTYPYTTERGLGLNDPSSTMDSVIAFYGKPDFKGTINNTKWYSSYTCYFVYSKDTLGMSFNMNFYFEGSDTNAYHDKEIIKIWLY